MKERFYSKLSVLWLTTAAVSLVLPVFLPSSANPHNFVQNVIGTATVTMFVLSFPSSLFGLPLLFLARATMGIDPNTMGGMYLSLFLLFVLGLVQWFWIVPSVFLRAKGEEATALFPAASESFVNASRGMETFGNVASREKSPVEVLIDDESNR